MAKVKFGQGVAKIMGTVGGTIFSQNKGGNYMKNYNIPTNPQTAKQLAVRANWTQITGLWSTLSQSQRDAWTALASTVPYENSVGDIYYLSGKNFFQKVNSVTLSVDETPFIDCIGSPAVPESPVKLTLAASAGVPDCILTSSEANVPANRIYIVDGAPQSGPAVVNNNSRYRRLFFADDGSIWNTANILNPYISVYGAISEGQRLDIRFSSFDKTNGMVSPFIKANCIVAV